MKPSSFMLLLLAAIALPARSSGQVPYVWSISASATSSFENTTPLVSGLNTFYLWLECTDLPPGYEDGMAAAEFDLVSSGGNTILAFTPMNGFMNAGSSTQLLLAVGGCPWGQIVAGSILTFVVAAGQLDIAPSATNGNKITVDCSATPQNWPIAWKGLGIDLPSNSKGSGDCHFDFICLYCDPVFGCSAYPSSEPCPPPNNCDDCPPVSVDPGSWGSTKAKYRN